jgi:Arc/MetJ family transcription regulator
MDIHMKTTLEIPDHLMRELKERAAHDGTTMSELVESALRRLLREKKTKGVELRPLPTFDGGGWTVDPADREALYEIFDAEDPLIQEMKAWGRRRRRVRR